MLTVLALPEITNTGSNQVRELIEAQQEAERQPLIRD